MSTRQLAQAGPAKLSFTPVRTGLLQRKCACGGTPTFGGECEACRKKKLQRKLAIGASNDPLEMEADWIADHVLAAPAHFAIRGRPPGIQRFIERPPAHAVTAPASVENVLAQPGGPMEPALRHDMEHRFGHDFSHVRVHSSLAAKQSAREVNAKAYTVGHDVVFAEGHYSPGTHEGRRLIAHELTHVVQQSDNPAPASLATEATANGRPQASVKHHTDVHLAREQLTSGAASVPAVQNRAEAVQRIFTPGLSLDALMGLIESIRPSESASGLYTLVRDRQGLTITQAEYEKIRASARQSLLEGLRKVHRKTEDAQTQYDAQHKIDEDQYIVSGIVRFVGGIKDPGESIRGNTRLATLNANAAQTFIERGELVRAAECLAKGERFAINAKTSSQEYVDNVISTAEVTATVLEVTAYTAAATVVVIAAILAAPAVIAAGQAAVPAVIAAARAAPLVAALGTGAVSTAPVVAVETVAVAAPAAVAAAAPAAVAVAAPAAVAVAAPAAVAIPATAAVAVPATAAASTLSTAALATAGVGIASATLSSDSPQNQQRRKPPFVLRLPQQKAPHLSTYQGWLGRLQSDPTYVRGNPAQLDKWHQALRIGSSHAIPRSVYERGHALGLTGEAGERRIRVPNWSRTKSTPMEVDHIIELQVTPPSHREYFNSMANYELLDRTSNGTSGPLLAANIAAERVKQVAFDPSAANRILLFEQVVLGGGTNGERWSAEDLQTGKQLDAYPDHVSP